MKTVQLTLELKKADIRKISEALAPKVSERKYRWKGGAKSTANLVDQLSLVTGHGKSEVVEMAVRLAALFINLAGAEAFDTISKTTTVEELMAMIEEIGDEQQ
ncbi:MAG: hypothetical protein LKJ94_07345 [Candidatus Methanomethylophilus sp.]|jgi:hypothetical protein|nr:hypothetical protein [Methanomethylophilus sp.]MCI2075485.1 hypothetical protein [Methanomethylophilus sp.]MCI2093307.1 hypothetical protein [Methanomethylophilus sp.]WII08824.1 hypothetical protein O8W32_06525 [Methanomassiliicoccales archaeon LGM-DZ1]